jgi:hypothetical protein
MWKAAETFRELILVVGVPDYAEDREIAAEVSAFERYRSIS